MSPSRSVWQSKSITMLVLAALILITVLPRSSLVGGASSSTGFFVNANSSVQSVVKKTIPTNLVQTSSSIDKFTTSSSVSPVIKVEAASVTKSTMSKAIFNLVKGIVGAGVLSLPAGIAAFGDAKSAIVPASLLILIMGIFSAYNFSLIGRICALTGASSYTQAWQQTLGTHTAWIPALSCTVKTMFALLAYSIVLAETFVGFVKALGLGFTRSQTLFGLTSIVLLPLCLMKNLSSLAPFSLMGILAMVFTAGVMAVRYLDGSYALTQPVPGKFIADITSRLPAFGTQGASAVLSPKTLILLCMLSTAYMAHFNSPKFYNELENNTINRFNTVVASSFGISISIFIAFAAFGFATFGKSSLGFILSNYSTKDSLIGLSRVMVSISLISTYPLVFSGCRDGALDLLGIPKEKRTPGLLNNLSYFLLTFITVAALLVKDLSFVLSFGGATLGNALIYIFPALMFRKLVKDLGDKASPALKREVHFASFSGLLGLVMGAIGANMAIQSQSGSH